MSNRFPLTLNTTNSTIEELPAGSNLDLSGSNISNVQNINVAGNVGVTGNVSGGNITVTSNISGGNISTTGVISASGNISGAFILGNGSQLTGITTSPAGSNTQVQFNDGGSFGSSSNMTFDKVTNTFSVTNSNIATANIGNLNITTGANLGSVANLIITGGSSGQVLTTDGLGDVSFTTINAASFTLNPVRAATIANLTFPFTGALTLDGIVLATGDRVLVKNQTTQTQNGIWVVNTGGAWTRASDFTTGAETLIGGVVIPVVAGTINRESLWQCSNATAITIDSTNITFIRQGITGSISFSTTTLAQPISTGTNSFAIGPNANAAATNGIAIGQDAFCNVNFGLAVGSSARTTNLGSTALGVGANASGVRAIAVGECNALGDNSVSIGLNSRSNTSGVSIGFGAGNTGQSTGTVAVGNDAGRSNQGQQAVAVGQRAGNISQGQFGVAIGFNTGNNTQGSQAVAVGYAAGAVTQGSSSIAVGTFAGATNLGANSIVIGFGAGLTNTPNSTIVINATGANSNVTTGNAFYVAPVRNVTAANVMYYNPSTTEITYGTFTGPSRDYLCATLYIDKALNTANAAIVFDNVGLNTANITYSTTTGNLLLPTGKPLLVSLAGMSYSIGTSTTPNQVALRWVYSANNVPVDNNAFTFINTIDVNGGGAGSSFNGGSSLDLAVNMSVSANIKLCIETVPSATTRINSGQLVVQEL